MSGVQANNTVADVLGEWGSALQWADLPKRIQHDVRLTWLDTIGSLLLGRDHPEVRALALSLLASDGPGNAGTVAGVRLSARNACLVNGLATGVDLLDGGNVASGGHVAGYILPAVVAEAQRQDATLERALTGFAVGYEIACRIGSSQRLRAELHPSATWNVIGAAVAVARMRDASAAQLAGTIGLAANLTLTTSWDATVHGATVRDIYHGMPSFLGSLAADLAEAGFTGGPRSVEITFGQLSSTQPFDREHAIGQLGQRWLSDETYTKIHPTCRSFHAALDAALDVRAELPADVPLAELEVTIGTEPFAFQQNAAVHYGSPLAARESLPVSAALALVSGRLAPQQFRGSEFAAEDVVDLATRVKVVREERATPISRPGWVHVTGPGIDVRRDVDIPAGNPGNRLPDDVVTAKFERNAAAFDGVDVGSVLESLLTGPLEQSFVKAHGLDSWTYPSAGAGAPA